MLKFQRGVLSPGQRVTFHSANWAFPYEDPSLPPYKWQGQRPSLSGETPLPTGYGKALVYKQNPPADEAGTRHNTLQLCLFIHTSRY